MSTVRIKKVETVNGDNNENLFDPFGDVITLRLTIDVSQDILELANPVAQVSLQIIAFHDNQIKFTETTDVPLGAHDQELYFWSHVGTADQIGLDWVPSTIFGFRGAVQILSPASPRSDIVDVLDVSSFHWFQVQPIFEL